MSDSPYDWLPSYPRPAYAGNAELTGTRTPISPMSAAGSISSFTRPGWAPSAPVSEYGAIPASPSLSATHPYGKPSFSQQYRDNLTPSRGSRYTGSISSKGSFGVAMVGEVVGRREVVEVPVQHSGLSLSAEALRTLDRQHSARRPPAVREPYNLSYGELSALGQAPVEPKVLIHPTHRATQSQSSVTPLFADAVELEGSPSPTPSHRRSVPLMEAARLSSLGSYKQDSYDEYNSPAELEGRANSAPRELPTSYTNKEQATSNDVKGGLQHDQNVRKGLVFGPIRISIRRKETPDKREWYGVAKQDGRKKWVIVSIVVFLILAIVIAATIGGLLG
ncbi:hypothetical protein LTR56_027116 [Elasticomyces elasticus]|nr:hypothetical protein LTR56_027116 [Elasticomyces elasticus]KAK3616185.1 hypothetical protein LTR22_027158 [Elasticomyces elasticus]KAK4898552.1 hypothetical protein LTR49_027794 [Elasticomyces elasticus]